MFEELEIAVSESKVDTVAMLLSAVSANPADFLTTTTTTSSSYSSTPSTYVNTPSSPPSLCGTNKLTRRVCVL